MQRLLLYGVEVKRMPPDKAMLSLLADAWLCLSVLGTLWRPLKGSQWEQSTIASRCVAEPPSALLTQLLCLCVPLPTILSSDFFSL